MTLAPAAASGGVAAINHPKTSSQTMRSHYTPCTVLRALTTTVMTRAGVDAPHAVKAERRKSGDLICLTYIVDSRSASALAAN